jgi:hypothetical protein
VRAWAGRLYCMRVIVAPGFRVLFASQPRGEGAGIDDYYSNMCGYL